MLYARQAKGRLVISTKTRDQQLSESYFTANFRLHTTNANRTKQIAMNTFYTEIIDYSKIMNTIDYSGY
jgi:hypothetical protein